MILVGPVRLREVDAAADDRRPRGHHLGRHGDRREAGQRPGAARPQPGDGVPELRALPPPDRLREHRVPAAAGRRDATRRSTRRSATRPRPSSSTSTSSASPGNLSGGQRQRVAMGRAIVRDAEAFLFDEPLSNLDAKLRGQMRTEIARLQKRLGITTVYVTHDQTEAMTLGDRVAVLKRGILQQLATPRELYDEPGQPLRGRLHRLPADELPARDRRGQPGEAAVRHGHDPRGQGREGAGQGPADRRHPPRALRGRLGDRLRARARARRSRPRSTSSSGWATRPTPTSRSRRRPRSQEQLLQLERDLDGEALRTQLVISLDGASRIKEGDEAEIWVDATQMHLFDPATGENLTVDTSAAGTDPVGHVDRRGRRRSRTRSPLRASRRQLPRPEPTLGRPARGRGGVTRPRRPSGRTRGCGRSGCSGRARGRSCRTGR